MWWVRDVREKLITKFWEKRFAIQGVWFSKLCNQFFLSLCYFLSLSLLPLLFLYLYWYFRHPLSELWPYDVSADKCLLQFLPFHSFHSFHSSPFLSFLWDLSKLFLPSNALMSCLFLPFFYFFSSFFSLSLHTLLTEGKSWKRRKSSVSEIFSCLSFHVAFLSFALLPFSLPFSVSLFSFILSIIHFFRFLCICPPD